LSAISEFGGDIMFLEVYWNTDLASRRMTVKNPKDLRRLFDELECDAKWSCNDYQNL
jgi:hypothetical protein